MLGGNRGGSSGWLRYEKGARIRLSFSVLREKRIGYRPYPGFELDRETRSAYTRVVTGMAQALSRALLGAGLTLCLGAPVCGETANLEPSSLSSETFRLDQFVTGKLALWQERLHLEDWKISLVMRRKQDLKTATLGGIHWDKKKKSATLYVLDAADYTMPAADMLKDMEFTIVHELVHLELASLPRSEASRTNEEFAVNQLAEALLRLERRPQ